MQLLLLRIGRIGVATNMREAYLIPILNRKYVGLKVGIKMTALEKYNAKLKEQSRLRKIEYNKNPHICKMCGKPILMNEDDRYNEVFKKKFCSLSCTGKYGQLVNPRIPPKKEKCKIDNFTDEELLSIYNSCDCFKDLERALGYANLQTQENVHNRFLGLGLNINDLKKDETSILNLTKKELFDRRSNWQNARSTIQKYARITYQNSDKPKKCIICGYDKHYEVAHIVAVSDFDDDTLISEINDINNLIALCPNHHWEYDNTDFDVENYL